MKLAVLMSVYNVEPYIRDSINSLLRQKNDVNLHIVIVNDGSTDGTANILSEIEIDNKEVSVITTENQGITNSRNVTLQNIPDSADLITFLDGDDLSPDGRFKRDLKFFEEDHELDVLYSTVRFFRDAATGTLAPCENSSTLDGRCVQLAAGIYRTSLIRKVGLFDVDCVMAEDVDFLLRLFEQKPNYLARDEIGVFYRRHTSNMTRDVKTSRREFARALLKSVKRRKKMANYTLPRDIFDAKQLEQLYEWDKL